jgi:hypothetical protein
MGERSSLIVLETVRCLGCDSVYTKPAGGGTALKNPGCPECGYLGWLPLSAQGASPQRRSAADRQPRRPA